MPEIGEYITETLKVAPYDGTTAATLTVTAPDATVTTPATSTSDSGHTWTAVVHYTQAEAWHLLWTVAGTGQGTKSRAVDVDAPYAVAAWAPPREQVADYVPGRTLAANTIVRTFDDTTRPTGEQVDRLIGAAVAWVLTATGTVHATLESMARACAAVRTAAFVELGYPTRQDDLVTADRLFSQALAMRTDLVAANEALTGTDPNDPSAALMPQWSFPPAPAWADLDM